MEGPSVPIERSKVTAGVRTISWTTWRVVHVFMRGPASCRAALNQAGQAHGLDHPSARLSNEERARACQALGIKHRFKRADLPPTGRRRTERPIGSSSRPCASGPTAGRTRTHRTEPQHWPAGNTITTGTARTAALAGPHPFPDSTRRETTSWRFTPRPCRRGWGSSRPARFSLAASCRALWTSAPRHPCRPGGR